MVPPSLGCVGRLADSKTRGTCSSGPNPIGCVLLFLLVVQLILLVAFGHSSWLCFAQSIGCVCRLAGRRCSAAPSSPRAPATDPRTHHQSRTSLSSVLDAGHVTYVSVGQYRTWGWRRMSVPDIG
eukprot:3246819-Rhodomonas_salina.1